MGKDSDGYPRTSVEAEEVIAELRVASACPEDALTAALRLWDRDVGAAAAILGFAVLRWPKSTAVRHALSRLRTDEFDHQARCALWGPSLSAQHILETSALEPAAVWATSSNLVSQRSSTFSRHPKLSWLNCLARKSSEHLTLHQLRRRGS